MCSHTATIHGSLYLLGSHAVLQVVQHVLSFCAAIEINQQAQLGNHLVIKVTHLHANVNAIWHGKHSHFAILAAGIARSLGCW